MYSCDHPGCGKSFTNKHSLKRHKTTHDPNKKYKCDVCSKSFSLPQYLKEHKVVHTDKRPFVCKFPGCGKSFRQAGKLSIHRKEHKNDSKSKAKVRIERKETDVSSTEDFYPSLFMPQTLPETCGFINPLDNYCFCESTFLNSIQVPSQPLPCSVELPYPFNDSYWSWTINSCPIRNSN
ncbi:unnamed protein product [Moneuplotes crassus]|uniref:C2H2-type domain-containing protein n=1 Tax=Euplotes crassus TaxID=5936 RepID=A0AAD1ULZ9_EUPCR|nr:unnamed protein product [Moneuplotes crassus]